MRDRPKPPRVEVVWVDAQAHDTGWIDVSEASACETAEISSVGHLLRWDRKTLVLTGSLGTVEGKTEANQVMTIPAPWVREVRRLDAGRRMSAPRKKRRKRKKA